MASAKEMESFLCGVFECLAEQDSEELGDIAMESFTNEDDTFFDMIFSTFESGGYLTTDRGVAVKFGGNEFHITIQKQGE